MISVAGLSYAPIGQRSLFSNLHASFGSELVGLVGVNGVGKSTLLKLVAGVLPVQDGHVRRDGSVGYVAQQVDLSEDPILADALGIGASFAALTRIEQGSLEQSDFDKAQTYWSLSSALDSVLTKMGLSHLAPSTRLKECSGGERTRAFLAGAILAKPDILLLDEPTNNLDRQSRSKLLNMLKSFDGGAIIVSHDRDLLQEMDRIVELTPHELKSYGGNFAFYSEQKAISEETLQRQAAHMENVAKAGARAAQADKERQERKASSGTKRAARVGLSKIELGVAKDRASATRGKSSTSRQQRSILACANAAEAKNALDVQQTVKISLGGTRRKTVSPIVICDQLVCTFDGVTPISLPVSFEIGQGERVALVGNSGAGKSTLMAAILGRARVLRGSLQNRAQHAALLDQDFSGMLDGELSIFDNFRSLNPEATDNHIHAELARYLFRSIDAQKMVKYLSGGEKLRAALACATGSKVPFDLLLLDEPTNNLDLRSVAQLEAALIDFQGALIVASHDETFLNRIGALRQILVENCCNRTRRG